MWQWALYLWHGDGNLVQELNIAKCCCNLCGRTRCTWVDQNYSLIIYKAPENGLDKKFPPIFRVFFWKGFSNNQAFSIPQESPFKPLSVLKWTGQVMAACWDYGMTVRKGRVTQSRGEQPDLCSMTSRWTLIPLFSGWRYIPSLVALHSIRLKHDFFIMRLTWFYVEVQ